MKQYTIHKIVFYTVLAVGLFFCSFKIGKEVGMRIKESLGNQEKVENRIVMDKYTKRYTDLCLTLNSKTVKLDAASTIERDNLINQFLLDSYALYDEVYRFTIEKELLTTDSDLYERAYTLLRGIYDSQYQAYESIESVIVQMGNSSIFVIEAGHNAEMTNEITRLACEEILEIDPSNQQARETLKKLN